MVGLPRSIIKRYGVTKKAWQVFRSGSRSRTARSRPVVAKVARRRKRGGFRGFARKAKARYGRGGVKLIQPSAMVYGAGRGYALRAAAPLLEKLPIPAAYKGVVGGAALSWGLAKFGNGFIRQVGMDGLAVENATLGAALSSQFLGGMTTTAAQSNASTNGWI